ncbi:DNA topoisomerase IB [Arthrobacter monumenti]
MVRLKRSHPDKPGITRRKRGKGFSYLNPDGSILRDRDELRRIKELVIPPAWTDVWICPHPNGHIQAIGTDDAGRRQYMYHPVWCEHKDREKFDRALELGRSLTPVRAAVTRQLREPEPTQQRAYAAAARIIDTGVLRVGNAEYATQNGSFGLTTLRCSHISVSGDTVRFDFPAKSGQQWQEELPDADLAAALKPMLRRGAGEDALAYRNGDGWHSIESRGLNAYIAMLARGNFTAKDFRTWHATVRAAMSLAAADPGAASGTARKKAVTAAMREVAEHLGNTMAVARSSYVDPRVVDLYMGGCTIPIASYPSSERSVVDLLGSH